MRNLLLWLFIIVQVLAELPVKAQYRFLTEAPKEDRLKVLWRYCTYNLISDKDSAATCRFLEGVAHIADSLHDTRLKKYATYFRMCSRLLFSRNYRQNFTPGDYETPAGILQKTRAWAQKNGYADIAAACEHNIGQVYYSEGHFGPAFEHLLKADEERRQIGYKKVPDIAVYLYELALDYYKFEEWDKALYYFGAASHYPFYIPWAELSNLEAIGRIYARKGEWNKAETFYRKTITRARIYRDDAWVGIASGSLGNMFLMKGQNDSALIYHRRNYLINFSDRAPEDAAKSALGIATVLIIE